MHPFDASDPELPGQMRIVDLIWHLSPVFA